MIKKIAWNAFKNTGDIDAFLEFKQIENIENNIKEIQNKTNINLENKEENPFPINLKIVLTGNFSLEKVANEDRDNFLKHQAVQILFPYIRTMVSNITSSSMMMPIVLPVIDVLTLFND